MNKEELLNIAKQLIMIAGKYSKISNEKEKKKILNIFEKFEKQLMDNNSKYSETILEFLLDLKNDLLSGRELNIDNLKTDEYFENYLLTKKELRYYNSLILEKSYRIIFNELKKENVNIEIIGKNLEKIRNTFLENIKKIDSKNVAKNLLIFTSFERKFPKKYLLNLYFYLQEDKQKKIILDLIQIWRKFIEEVKKYGIVFYKEQKFNYKYIGFTNIDGKSILNEKIIDCSKINYRTGFAKIEYLNLLKRL